MTPSRSDHRDPAGMTSRLSALVADMSAGIILMARPDAANLVDDVIAQAKRAHQLGVAQVWLPQQQNYDAIALAALVGAAVPGLGVGTSVVPINPRHPLIIASLAQTAQAAAHGSFSLGLGLGARQMERQAFGTEWPNSITRLREHLTILASVFNTGGVDFHGSELSASPPGRCRSPAARRSRCTWRRWAPRHCESPANWPTGHCLTWPGPGLLENSSCPKLPKRQPRRAARHRASSPRCPCCCPRMSRALAAPPRSS